MPYRRLPNTDQARVRALRTLLAKEDSLEVYDYAVSLRTLSEVRNFLPRIEAAQRSYQECYERQAAAGRKHQEHVRLARLYVSHFIQVLNMSVLRGEIRKSDKELYGLSLRDNVLPDLTTESALVEWGEKVIAGEQRRTTRGGTPIYNPTVAKVKVHYDIFKESHDSQKRLQTSTARCLERLAAMRESADHLILDVWNQIETHFADIASAEERLEKCREYGVVYYYRTSEKRKMKEADV